MTDIVKEKHSSSKAVSEEIVKNLSLGLTSIYQPTLKALRTQLLEITKKQEFLINELHSENIRLSETIYSDEFQKMFLKIKLYKDKLTIIKRDMMMIHEQSTKLKKRALKLEQQKQKEALEKVQKREYEELLITKSNNKVLSNGDIGESRNGELLVNGNGYVNICPVCRVKMHPRNYHCHICQECIPKYDHHSYWLNCCIGEINLHYFVAGSFFGIFALAYASLLIFCIK